VREHERRALEALDGRGHRHRLAGAGGAEQGRVALAGGDRLAIESIAFGWSAVGE
jgi:hypothetical protein